MAARAGLAGQVTQNLRRLDGPPRIPGVDLARGLAVVGMLAAHLFVLPEFSWTAPESWAGIAGGRSSILFATLAGVSIALVTSRGPGIISGDDRARRRVWLAKRALALWVLGILLIATGVPVFVILPAYALLFVLAIPFLGARPATLWAWAAGIAGVVPWLLPLLELQPWWDAPLVQSLALVLGWAYPAPLWLAFLLAGMALGRADLTNVRTLVLAAGAGAGLVLAVAVIGEVVPEASSRYLEAVWSADAHSGGLREVWGSAGFVVAVIAVCILACRVFVVRALVLPVRALGALALTAYSAQILVWAVWSALVLGTTTDLFGFHALHPFWPLTLGIAAACTAWVLVFGRGPLERVVDMVSRSRADRLGR